MNHFGINVSRTNSHNHVHLLPYPSTSTTWQRLLNACGFGSRLERARAGIAASSMIDTVSPEVRSKMMSAIRGRNTAPEMVVRRMAHALGYRFRLHGRALPGTPDLVFPSRRSIVFVHGCYWHGHGCGRGGKGAKSNQDYWGPKIARNRERDSKHLAELESQGWRVLIIWECEAKNGGRLGVLLREFLG